MVGQVLYKSSKFRNSAQVVGMKKCGSASSSSNLRNGVSMNVEPSVAREEESSTNETNSKLSRSVSVDDSTVKKRKKFDRMKRITMMFLVATAVSYIGYLPNLILGYMKAFNGKVYDEASDVLGPFNSILLRGYFINNATNPVVYCFLDDRFRRECKNLYHKFHQVLCDKFACEINYELFIQMKIPAIIYLTFISFIGILGNFHAIVVYYLSYKPSNHRTLIIALALVDLAGCLFCVPFEIFELRYEYVFTFDPACKIFRFLNHVTATASGFLLGVIAVERHRKVCRPTGCQISKKSAKVICIVTVIASVLLSIPSFIVYGPTFVKVSERPDLDLYGHDCTVLGSYEDSVLVKVFISLLLLLTTVVFVMCFVIYVMVGKVIYRQVQFRKKSQMKKADVQLVTCSLNGSGKDRLGCSSETLDSNLTQEEDSSETDSSNHKINSKISVSSTFKSKTKKTKTPKTAFSRSKKITLMFLVATAISYLSYIPNIMLVLMKAFNKPLSTRAEMDLGFFSLILMRSYFISNITNPIVYCFVDDRFRQECFKLYRKLYARFRKRNFIV
ncbi:hypothetical protein KUTeg_000537 [Tegillarca granosa]|uniref:G-protein coupled receptors family 1 profile domain-containing protein n=1 Tax=Tegillarca granosa TaxID=220873 RepID=A0ABQ9FZ71_TEGGR|nr:hypothetical protein KUTeg_000537 [Tegillarca granosa]